MSAFISPTTSSSPKPLPSVAERRVILDELKDIVTPAEFRKGLEQARAELDSPTAGYFGPDSVMWKLVRPMPLVMLMLWYAGILEVFEPRITAGFSAARTPKGEQVTAKMRQDTEPLPRYARSYEAFFDWFVGDEKTASRTAARIFGYHSRIVTRIPDDIGGSKYHAGDPFSALEPQLMVLTLLTQLVPLRKLYERFYGPLTPSESLQYQSEMRTFARLLGADPDWLPDSWDACQQWLDDFYRDPGNTWIDEDYAEAVLGIFGSRTLAVLIINWSAESFPPALAERLHELPQLKRFRWAARALDPVLRLVFRHAPEALMVSPRYRDAMERVGRRGWTRGARIALRVLPRPFGIGSINLSDINESASPRMKAVQKVDKFLVDSDEVLADSDGTGGCPMGFGASVATHTRSR